MQIAKRLVALMMVLALAPFPALPQCSSTFVFCNNCGFGVQSCVGCGTSSGSFVGTDYGVFCATGGGACLYCGTGCQYPYDYCQLTRLDVVYRCSSDEQYSSVSFYLCCKYC